jgi:GGDEF domain-containing protein
MNKKTYKLKPLNQIQRLYVNLLIFAASLFASALVVIYNNSPRSSPFFIFLIFFGVGIMLILGLIRGTLASMFLISTWIVLKQLLGVWEQIRLLDNVLELIIVGLTFIFSGIFHNQLEVILNTYTQNQNQLRQLDIEDKTVGLIRPPIGLLRLNEEEDRSVRYGRPFALVLILVRPLLETGWEPDEGSELMRAIATSIKDTTRETDIPFLVGNNKIAIILPETETSGGNRVVNNVLNRMTMTRFITESGNSMLIHECVQLRFGFAAFLGNSHTKLNMMEAAERSLQLSLEINIDELFQNIFIEWVTLGEPPLSTPLFESRVS